MNDKSKSNRSVCSHTDVAMDRNTDIASLASDKHPSNTVEGERKNT